MVPPQDRPLNALRESTIDQLIVNYGHGKIALDAFERRLDLALDATTHDSLIELTRDLDLDVDKEYAERKRKDLGIGLPTARQPSSASRAEPADDVDRMINVFGGSNRGGVWAVAPQIDIVNVFGGAELDFSSARFTAPTTTISMFCLFGGVDLYVSEGINVISKVVCIFGGVDNRAHSGVDPDAPTIVLRGLLLFGGADVKIRKTAKERLLEFAESVRAMFAPPEQRRVAK